MRSLCALVAALTVSMFLASADLGDERKEGMPPRVDACAARQGQGGGRGGARPGGPIGPEVYRSEDGGRTWRKTHGDEIDVAGAG
jgi:hypothetical protein